MLTEHSIQLILKCDTTSGARWDNIQRASEIFGFTFLESYSDLLQFTDGMEGFIGSGAYLMLWSVDELIDTNKAYAVPECDSGFILFASDGGGTAYAFDIQSPFKPIVEFHFISNWRADGTIVARDINGLLIALESKQDI